MYLLAKMHKDGLHASVVISGHHSLCDTCLPYQHSLDNFSRRHMCNQMGNANQQSHRTSYQWHLPVTTKHTRDTMKRSGRKKVRSARVGRLTESDEAKRRHFGARLRLQKRSVQPSFTPCLTWHVLHPSLHCVQDLGIDGRLLPTVVVVTSK